MNKKKFVDTETDFIADTEKDKFKKEHILEACPLLLCNDIFDIITRRELDKVIVGELESRQTIFLCAMGSLVKNCTTSSYNLLVNDSAGTGKDYITSKTLSVLPKHLYIKRTRISPTAFTYWHNSHFEPNWTWQNKTLYLEDVSNNVLNSEVFKVMCSSGSYATIVKDQRAVDIKIEGKPVIIITSATANPNPELTRRFSMVDLDSGINQTQEIVKHHLKYAETGEIPEIDETISYALSNLLPVKVKIPYASYLSQFIPNDSIIMRTHVLRLLDYIKASCALHQWQRKSDSEGFLVATEQDYAIARIALKKTTSNQYMIPLTKDQKRILEVFEKLGEGAFSVSELEPKITWLSEKWMRDQLDKLVNYGLLIKQTEENFGTGRKHMVYKKININIKDLPESINLKVVSEEVVKVLDIVEEGKKGVVLN